MSLSKGAAFAAVSGETLGHMAKKFYQNRKVIIKVLIFVPY